MSHNGLLKIMILKLFVVGSRHLLRLPHLSLPPQGYHYTGLQCLLSQSTLSSTVLKSSELLLEVETLLQHLCDTFS